MNDPLCVTEWSAFLDEKFVEGFIFRLGEYIPIEGLLATVNPARACGGAPLLGVIMSGIVFGAATPRECPCLQVVLSYTDSLPTFNLIARAAVNSGYNRGSPVIGTLGRRSANPSTMNEFNPVGIENSPIRSECFLSIGLVNTGAPEGGTPYQAPIPWD